MSVFRAEIWHRYHLRGQIDSIMGFLAPSLYGCILLASDHGNFMTWKPFSITGPLWRESTAMERLSIYRTLYERNPSVWKLCSHYWPFVCKGHPLPWNRFPHWWLLVRRIHRNSPHKEPVMRGFDDCCLLEQAVEQTDGILLISNAILFILHHCVEVNSRIKLSCNMPLQWRHNEHDGVSNHQLHDCLLNRLFRRRSKKTSKLRVTGLCAGKSPVNSPHKWPVTRKMFPFDDVIMRRDRTRLSTGTVINIYVTERRLTARLSVC